ncbi:beta-methylgalactoside transporter [Butyricicoccus faecihominis]|uniref:galactose/methyl galactoside ABC transporter permease MglC n=1 Tax=Butyricicoccaceae TaxID=3085642 RepID=UPI0024785254|nr:MULTISPECIES: beta-methylgalactoside transporter [Butyricicoccaceae]MCQ5129743.1 beta-methylgalactoside transporter [Butyricicoccus faecihominis]WNX84271.1 beta-methylgalactoside transporter [Agathobaculum sp. NTUH-O15-33]
MGKLNIKGKYEDFKALSAADKRNFWKEWFISNSLYIFLIVAAIGIGIYNNRFFGIPSIVNMLSLTAANLPIAMGIAGTIVLTGTDLSAGRVVGLTACISAALLQAANYPNRMFPDLPQFHPAVMIICTLLIVMVVGAIVGFVNGFSVAKFGLHPFIVTLATQLIVYGFLLLFTNLNGNSGAPISGLSEPYKKVVNGSFLSIGKTPIPNFVWYALAIAIIMWFIWNKTRFGKNMFACGSNPEAANVSGVNVAKNTMMVFILAGVMYSITGFIEAARIGSNSPSTGLNYELDAIAACVIGGVSFVGGIGSISGIIVGVLLLRIIFVGLTFLSVSANLQYIIKGLIILIACAIDMRKYLVRK